MTDDDDIGADVKEGLDPLVRTGDHEVNLERFFGEGTQLPDEVGEKEEVGDVMAVGHVQVEFFRMRFHPFEVVGQTGEIRGPKGSGALYHGAVRH